MLCAYFKWLRRWTIIDMTKLNQTKQELKVFKSFAKHYPCKIEINSIEKRYPPEPDIYCKLVNGEKISFEITECVDNRIMKKWSDYTELRNLIKTEIQNLSDEDKRELHKKYYDASILVIFNENFTVRKKEKSIPFLIEYLLSIPTKNNLSGEIEIKSIKEIKRIFITRTRGYNKVPDIDLPGIVTDFDEYSLKTIKNKFSKNYQTDNEIELIIYYYYQYDITDLNKINFIKTVDFIKTIDFIKENISKTSFKRVWLYSYTNDKVLYYF